MLQILQKDLKILLSDKRALFLKFALPIILISVFVVAFSGLRQDTKLARISKIKLLVVNNDESVASRFIIEQLSSKESLELELMDIDRAERLIKQGKRIAALVIKTGFTEAFIKNQQLPWEIVYQEGRDMEFGMLRSILIPQLVKIGMNFNVLSGVSTPSNSNLEDISEDKRLTFRKVTPEIFIKNDPWLVQPIAGVAFILLLFNVTGLGGSIIEESESGTLKRLVQSPIKPTSLFWGKFWMCVLVSFLQLILMFTYAWLIFGLKITHRLPELLLIILVSTLSLSGFGMLIAIVSKTRSRLQGISTSVILVMSALGGSMIPLFIMPEFMQNMAMLSMNYWGLESFYDLLWRDLDFQFILQKLIIMAGIGLLTMTLSMRLFRKRYLYV